MRKRSRRSVNDRVVSASDLAQMGVCERLVVFEQRYGKRRTPMQQQAIRRGQYAHQRFYRNRHLDIAANGDSSMRPWSSVLYGWLRRAVRVALRPIHRCIDLWAKAVEPGDDS